jgi:hypothetical protein
MDSEPPVVEFPAEQVSVVSGCLSPDFVLHEVNSFLVPRGFKKVNALMNKHLDWGNRLEVNLNVVGEGHAQNSLWENLEHDPHPKNENPLKKVERHDGFPFGLKSASRNSSGFSSLQRMKSLMALFEMSRAMLSSRVNSLPQGMQRPVMAIEPSMHTDTSRMVPGSPHAHVKSTRYHLAFISSPSSPPQRF